MVTAERLSRLLLLLYEGASTPGRTQAFLNELVDAVGAKGAVLREIAFSTDRDVRVDVSSLNETVGYPKEALSFTETICGRRTSMPKGFSNGSARLIAGLVNR